MRTLWQDLKYGVRMLLRNPGFSFIAVITLALGIGANTAIFSVVNAVLLRSLPYADAERIVKPATVDTKRDGETYSISFADFQDWRNENVFQYVAAYDIGTAETTGQGEPERLNVALITEDYFNVMGAKPLLGRYFSDEENKGTGIVTVISYGIWQKQFGGDKNVIGKPIRFNGQEFTIIGVTPQDSQYPETAQTYVPISRVVSNFADPDFQRRDNFIFQAIARLKQGVSVEETNAHLATISKRIEQQEPVIRKGIVLKAFPLHEWIVGKQLRRALLVLLVAVGFVLLIVSVNIANLLLARAASREREIAIRSTMGASRWRLIRQLLTESLLLGVLGGVCGLLLARWGVDLLVSFAPSETPRLKEVSMDWRVLCFALFISLLTAIVVGLIPALRLAKTNLSESLKEGGRTSSGGLRNGRLRGALVVTEIALSLVLLMGAGLMVRSFNRLQKVELGFNENNVLAFEFSISPSRYKETEKQMNAFRELTERINSVPGVQSASVVSALPLNGGGFYLGRVFLREGQAEPPADKDYNASWNVISPDYFNTMSIGLLKGRIFTGQDNSKSTPVIIINETLARQMFPNDNPIGKRIRSWRDENLLREIVGVVRDVRYQSRDEKPYGLVYVPHLQQTEYNSMVMVVRTSSDSANFVNPIRDAVHSFDKDLAIANVQTMQRVLSDSSARPRFNTLLLSIFAIVALLLASVGIYGVMSYTVTERTHEIGIRMALGAKKTDVLKLVVGRAMLLALIGVGIGLAASFGLMRLLSSLLFGVSTTDPVTFVLVSFVLVAVALAACYLPARRATKVDPMTALRYE